ncbi:MAG: two-component regulator propeller domain-containing protein, partial [Bacteroidota bacterium]
DGVFVQIATENSSLPSNATRTVFPDSDGTVWMGTDEGFTCWRDGEIQYSISQQNGLPGNTVNCFFRDRLGTFWVGTDAGLVRFDEDSRNIETLNQALGLSHSTIEDMVEDPEGCLWLGTYRGGINRIKDGKFSNFGTPEDLPDDIINVTYPDGDKVWVGTDNGLALFENNTIVQFSLGNTSEENRIRDIIRDSQGRLWVCTHGGLVQFGERQIITRLTEADGLTNSRIRNILEDSKGRLWVGTPSGLNCINPDGSIEQYSKEKGIENEFIMSLFENRQGNIWVGTNGGGIYVIREGGVDNLTKVDGLAADVIFRMTEDPEGYTWIGTTGGLSVLHDNQFKSIGLEQGLMGNSVFQLVIDQEDSYWLTTDRGVVRIERTELQKVVRNELDQISNSKLFTDADGMRSRETTGASKMGISPDGRLWIPTQLGVTVIDPLNIPLNTIPPPVQIESVLVNQEQQKDEEGTVIKIPPGKNRIEIKYTALTYFAPKNVQFRYRLEGYEDSWQEAGINRIATYTNLPPGGYTFQVIASNNDGIWNTEGASISLSKTAKFVQTPYFYLLLIIGIGVIGFIGYYVRLTTLNTRNQLLSEMVEERTYNIQQQSEAIRQQAEELETINSIVQTINQELELDRVLDALLTEAMKLFPQAERASFLTFNDENHKYEFSATKGLNIEEFSQVRLTPQEAFSTFGDDYQELEEGVYIVKSFRDVIGKLTLKNVKSSLVMTIKLGAFPEGFLFLFNTTNLRAFDKSDSARLKRFRDH